MSSSPLQLRSRSSLSREIEIQVGIVSRCMAQMRKGRTITCSFIARSPKNHFLVRDVVVYIAIQKDTAEMLRRFSKVGLGLAEERKYKCLCNKLRRRQSCLRSRFDAGMSGSRIAAETVGSNTICFCAGFGIAATYHCTANILPPSPPIALQKNVLRLMPPFEIIVATYESVM